MKSPLVLLIPVLLALTIPACESRKAEPKPAPAAETAPTSQDDKKEEQPKLVNEFFIEGKLVNEFFIEGDSLSYKGYDVIKLKKEVYDREWCAAGRTRPCMVPVAYTAIKRNGKVLAQFDDYHYGLGNVNDVALYPLLGGESRQLIISQTGPRDGRHYVVELAEKPRVIFDSGDYEVGREEVWIQDVDNDGVYEISMLVVSFYMALNLSPWETPLPTV
ncbi:MAG TPA: hypothetical protein VG778_03550 [Blastocatellia bacterium]|nr:hypothetical protein [Blastocatellia bacterium]